MKKRFHITYNAPVTLTFSILCALILVLNQFALDRHLIPAIFTCPGNRNCPFPFEWNKGINYIRLFTHIFGHSDWNHLLNNLAFILLLGPIMEERYGSAMMTLMLTVTAFVTGIINVCFIPHALLGASGISFMLIILTSISTIDKNELPVSFIFILAIYIGRELYNGPTNANISTVAHIAGGLCGSMFGFFAVPKTRRASSTKTSPATEKSRKSPRNLKEEKKPYSQDKTEKPAKNQNDDDATIVGTIEL